MSAPWSIEELVEKRGLVLHNETQTLGRAVAYFDGVDRRSLGLDGKEVPAPVLQLDTGDTFVVKPYAFTPLSDREAAFVGNLQSMVRDAAMIAIGVAASLGMDQQVVMQLAAFVMDGTRKRFLAEVARLTASRKEVVGG